jgi:hypothetical protein
MYDNWLVNGIVVAATAAALVLCVLLHYEGLLLTIRGLERFRRHRRVTMLYAISSVMLLHVTQIWIFALGYWTLLQWPEFGGLGPGYAGLLDAVYFSTVAFTTVGYGDLTPTGPIRFLAGTESLTGFVLIAWSASFTYLEMERYWRPGR